MTLASDRAEAQAQARMQQASPATIDWIARACTADSAFGLRFGAPPGRRHLSVDESRHPFSRVGFNSTERTGRLFLAETVGMFRLAPGSTQSDRPAGQRLFEAIDARIVELGLFSQRDYVVEEDGDIEITYSHPTADPESRVVLELTLMLGGAWFTCKDLDIWEQQFREVFG